MNPRAGTLKTDEYGISAGPVLGGGACQPSEQPGGGRDAGVAMAIDHRPVEQRVIDVKEAYARLLVQRGSPLVRLQDVMELTESCLEQGLGPAEIVELHLSLVQSAADAAWAETILGLTLSFRTLLMQVQEREETIHQLEWACNEISAVYRSKSTMLSMVAHDLSNYLVTFRVLALTLMRDSKEEATRERARQLLSVVEDQDRLLSQLSSMGRLEAGALTVQKGIVDLRMVVYRCVQSMRRISTHTFAVTGPGLKAFADEEKVRQILDNLVGNAVKFSAGGSRIEIRLSEYQGQAMVEVCDQGIGIPPEDLPHLFEPYYRGEGNLTKGTGLGLSIVWALVQLMGGTIEVQSQPGDTVMRFTLPLAAEATGPGDSVAGRSIRTLPD